MARQREVIFSIKEEIELDWSTSDNNTRAITYNQKHVKL